MARATKPRNVSELLERLLKNHTRTTISVDDLLAQFGQRAYDPLLFIGGLLLISPIGGLPGATIILGSFIVLVAGQSLFVETPWLPKWLRKRKAPTAKARKWICKALPVLERVERVMRLRFSVITTGRWKHVSSLLIVAIGASTYLLGLVPGGLFLPGFAIMFISMARLHHDGLLMALGMLGAGGSFGLLYYAL